MRNEVHPGREQGRAVIFLFSFALASSIFDHLALLWTCLEIPPDAR